MSEQAEFRNYVDSAAQDRVEKNYKDNHTYQNLEFVKAKKARYSKLEIPMTIWEAMDLMKDVVDESDPDTELPQIVHALQTAEAIREQYPDEEHDWFPLTGLIHDLGKVLAHPKFGSNPQWAVVGDTFPVGCKFSDKIVFPQHFKQNPDYDHPTYSTLLGIYSEGCGLENVHMSWGHDEYMYRVCVGNGCTLPEPALNIIRYHSFYAWHKGGAYEYLLSDKDRKMLPWINAFSKFDLYTKHGSPPDVEKLLPYYKSLLTKYFPTKMLKW